MKNAMILNKDFNFVMPLKKGYDGDDGYYHIQFAISGSEPDLQKDQMTDNALQDIVTQAKGIQVDGKQIGGINIDDYHQDGLNALLGPVTDAWITEEKQVFVDLRVRKQWEETIRDLVTSETQLGGSITGKATKVLPGLNKNVRQIDGVRIFKAALTDIPAAWETRGTAEPVEKGCPHNICSQIMKSLDLKKEAGSMGFLMSDSYEAIKSRVRSAVVNAYDTVMGERQYNISIEGTWSDMVVFYNYEDGKFYSVPYTMGDAGEITLGELKEADNMFVAKKLGISVDELIKKVGETMKKGVKGEEVVPEGIDQGFIDAIKDMGEDGKQFIKGILGIKETEEPEKVEKSLETGSTGEEPGLEDTKGQNMEKKYTEEDLKKAASMAVQEAQAPLIKRLDKVEGIVDTNEATSLEKTKTDLLTKSLDLHKKIKKGMTPEEESDLVKEIKTDLEKDNGPALVERDIMTMTKTLENIADGDKPSLLDNGSNGSKTVTKDAETAADLRKKIAQRGVE